MITSEQVADLRKGDVVEVSRPDWQGAFVRGPLRGQEDDSLRVGPMIVRRWTGVPPAGDFTLTVVSRARRPLYVNHPRTVFVVNDVVRDEATLNPAMWCRVPLGWRRLDSGGVCSTEALPPRLRLLVDGETGQVVPS